MQTNRAAFHLERLARISKATALDAGRRAAGAINPFAHSDLIDFHVARGLDRHHVTEGSMPATSLRFIHDAIRNAAIHERPFHGLHIGNYVGVSLAYLSAAIREKHAESRMFAIDPNLPHRGTSNPQSHVAELLQACGITKSVVLLAGFSGLKSISNDGVVFDDYDPLANYESEAAIEGAVKSLAKVCRGSFRFALIDGNHEAEYLRAEIAELLPLLADGAIIAIDDADDAWPELKAVYESAASKRLRPLGTDGRVGLLAYCAPAEQP